MCCNCSLGLTLVERGRNLARLIDHKEFTSSADLPILLGRYSDEHAPARKPVRGPRLVVQLVCPLASDRCREGGAGIIGHTHDFYSED